jgi:hypothetical protein
MMVIMVMFRMGMVERENCKIELVDRERASGQFLCGRIRGTHRRLMERM